MLRAWVLALLLLAFPCAAQVVGVAYYAMPAFTEAQCNLALSVFRGVKVPALSYLWGSFGSNSDCLSRFVRSKSGDQSKRIVHIHSVNNTCRHKPRRCTAYDLPAFRPRMRAIAEFIREHKGASVRWLVSIGLEDDYTASDAERRRRIARRELPRGVGLVRNTDEGRFIRGFDFHEHHGLLNAKACKPAGRCLYSNDGDVLPGWSALQRRYASLQPFNRYLFVWTPDPQRHCRDPNRWVEPRRRCLRFNSDEFRKLNVLLRRLQNGMA